jgi:subtilisin family serine protease
MSHVRAVSAFVMVLFIVAFGMAALSVPAAESNPPPPAPDPRQKALFDKLQVEEAWKVTKGDPKVVVGVIDNGFDFFHPNLKGQLEPGYYYAGGYHPEVYHNIAHGTLVASLIVARGQGNGSMCGLAPCCKVLTACQGTLDHKLVKLQSEFFRTHPKATIQDFQKVLFKKALSISVFAQRWATYQVGGAAEAIRYLTDHGVRVINVSGGLRRGLCPNQEAWTKLEDAFTYAARKNVVIVLSAGNDGALAEDYPGDTRSVIVVGATLLNDKRWEQEVDLRGMKFKQGSSFGKRLTCVAPVQDLLVCSPHEQRMYNSADGPYGPTTTEFKGPHQILKIGATSSAAPIVSALAALVISARPDLDGPTVVELIKQGCDNLGARGFDVHTGYGRINFARTLQLTLRHGK